MTAKIRALIVDDSAVVRQVLTHLLNNSDAIEVIGAVSDPIFAMAKMNQDWPDVVVLDVEMPRMDGITFLKQIMAVRPTPVVICSTLTKKGAETTLQALSTGAVGIVTKPKAGLKSFLAEDSGDIVQVVKAAAVNDMRRMKAINSSRFHLKRVLSDRKLSKAKYSWLLEGVFCRSTVGKSPAL